MAKKSENAQLIEIVRTKLISGIGKESIINEMVELGMNYDSAEGLVDTVLKLEEGYFSFTSSFKRKLAVIFNKPMKDDEDRIFKKMSNFLVFSKLYDSLDKVEEKIKENVQILKSLENEGGHHESLYWESTKLKRKVFILMNAHGEDYPESILLEAMNLLGREKVAKNIDKRAKFMLNKVAQF